MKHIPRIGCIALVLGITGASAAVAQIVPPRRSSRTASRRRCRRPSRRRSSMGRSGRPRRPASISRLGSRPTAIAWPSASTRARDMDCRATGYSRTRAAAPTRI